MIVHRCEQYTAEWFTLRRGVPTASAFDKIITPKTGKLAAAHEGYVCELIADLCRLDYPGERAATPAMRNGTLTEPEARRFYEMERDVEQVGICFSDDGRFACSPDGLVGDDGLLELKCPEPKTHVGYLLANDLPTEYVAQVHGQLIVTGRKWVDFMSYCPGFRPLLVRVEPCEFTDKLRDVLEEFWPRLQRAKAVVRGEANQ